MQTYLAIRRDALSSDVHTHTHTHKQINTPTAATRRKKANSRAAAAYGAARSIANGTRPRVHSGGVSCSNRLLGETLVFANCLAATECFTLWKLFFPELVYTIRFSRNLNATEASFILSNVSCFFFENVFHELSSLQWEALNCLKFFSRT